MKKSISLAINKTLKNIQNVLAGQLTLSQNIRRLKKETSRDIFD